MIYQVYRNLNNGKLSIQHKASGLVVGHADEIVMSMVDFKVNEKGRQRVIKEGRKNVHAFMLGMVSGLKGFKPFKGRMVNVQSSLPLPFMTDDKATSVTYNPYKSGAFVSRETLEPVHKAQFAKVDSKGSITVF